MVGMVGHPISPTRTTATTTNGQRRVTSHGRLRPNAASSAKPNVTSQPHRAGTRNALYPGTAAIQRANGISIPAPPSHSRTTDPLANTTPMATTNTHSQRVAFGTPTPSTAPMVRITPGARTNSGRPVTHSPKIHGHSGCPAGTAHHAWRGADQLANSINERVTAVVRCTCRYGHRLGSIAPAATHAKSASRSAVAMRCAGATCIRLCMATRTRTGSIIKPW